MDGLRLLSLPLFPLAWLFGGLVWLRNKLFDWGVFRQARLPIPVLAVGNLAMGGSGKTPVCAALAEMVVRLGGRPLILSRGYKRREGKRARKVDPEDDWQFCGDEPMLLARRLRSKGDVCVGPSRLAAARCVVPDDHTLAIVDDGFQHRALARDLDVVLIDGAGSKPRLFPVALFRESLTALKRADLLLVTGLADEAPFPAWLQPVLEKRPQLQCGRVHFEPDRLVHIGGGASESLSLLRGARVACFCGIARPFRFFDGLERLGAHICHRLVLPDHAALNGSDRLDFYRQARAANAEFVITTEKDAVKFEKDASPDILTLFLAIRTVFSNAPGIEEKILAMLDKGVCE